MNRHHPPSSSSSFCVLMLRLSRSPTMQYGARSVYIYVRACVRVVHMMKLCVTIKIE